MNTLYWHDYETFGVDPARDCPSQFAGIRTNESLDVVGEPLRLYCRPPLDRLPSPVASLVTGITPQDALQAGVPERTFIEQIHRELSVPGTCGVGYNSIRFDDEVTRHTLYRNFYDPYEREWKQGNSRWDIIDMLRLARALRPDGIEWPNYDDGSSCFRLEQLTAANGISHESAHDALSDVMATIAMARLVRDRQPQLYHYVYEHRLKHKVAEVIDLNHRKPFLHVSGKLPRENGYTALMMPLVRHPVNKNSIICFNLMGDAQALIDLSPEQIFDRLFTRTDALPEDVARIALKGVQLNRCPVVTTPRLMDSAVARGLGIDLEKCEKQWQLLLHQDLTAKLAAVFSNQQYSSHENAEQALYDGFPSDADKALFAAVRSASASELASGSLYFQDPRYRELLFLYRAKNFPETLSDEERQQWQEHRFQQITDGRGGYLSLNDFHEQIEALHTRESLSERDKRILHDLREWGNQIL
ncbi:exodeoxyribonuclease I [Porticoccus sp.]|uniref:exodeoxyribonuclease I n=1 Tax=Porticoccus sp. TaxID=2024853 RepID=UPI003F69B427